METVVIVLAAGRGARFGAPPGHKLVADLAGRPLAAHAIDAARRAAVGPVLVVTGPVPLSELLGRRDPGADVTEVANPRWAEGQATSLRAGIDAAVRLGASAVVVGLADQPFVPPEAWRRVAASRSPIAIATYEGRRRNPVRLERSVWPLLPEAGDAGARVLFELRSELVEAVPCPGSPADIDTPEELQRWQNRSSTSSR